MDMMTQAKELEARPHIIVATPGRLCDLLRSDGSGGGKLSRVKVLVRPGFDLDDCLSLTIRCWMKRTAC
jgi:superfamily II DNA/RNA helicase